MPSLQTVDLSPLPRKPTTLENTVAAFSNKHRQNQIEQQNTDALSQIYKQHQNDGDNLINTIKTIQTTAGMSPTARVSAIDQLTKFQAHNVNLQKQTIKRLEDEKKADKEQRQRENRQQVVSDIEKDRNLQPGSLAAYEDNPALAERLTRPKAGRQGDEPINEDQLRRIQHVRNLDGYEEASPSKKYQMLTDNGVSGANADREAKIYAEEAKVKAKESANKPEAKYEEKRVDAIHKYINNAIEDGQAAREKQFAIDEARKAIKGNITGPGLWAIAKNDPHLQLYLGLTPDEALLQAANKHILKGESKGIFGSKPTEREIFLLLNSMLPAIGKSREANEAGLGFIEKINKMEIAKEEIINELTDNGVKYVPDIQAQVAKRMEEAAVALRDELREANQKFNGSKPVKASEPVQQGQIRVKDPDGKIWRMTQDQIDNAAAQGVKFEPA